MSNIPIYVPQGGGNGIPVYQPRQGGGGFGKLGNSFLHMVKPKLETLKNDIVDYGAKAATNVAQKALEGEDIRQAIQEEGTKAKLALKQKVNERADQALTASKTFKKKTKGGLDKLFT